MESMLSTLAFGLLIGGQFLAAIVLISKRKTIYDPTEHAVLPSRPISDHANENGSERLPAKAA